MAAPFVRTSSLLGPSPEDGITLAQKSFLRTRGGQSRADFSLHGDSGERERERPTFGPTYEEEGGERGKGLQLRLDQVY